MRRVRALRLLHGYVALVSVAGGGLLLALLARWDATPAHRQALWLFVALVAFGELRPVAVRRPEADGEVTISTTFGYALLLYAGAAPAALALSLSCLLADLGTGKPWYKATFNVAQYTLAVGGAAAVLAVGGYRPDALLAVDVAWGRLWPLLPSALAFFALNYAVTGTAVALAKRTSVLAFLRRDLTFQMLTAGVLLALSPVAVVLAAHHPVLVLLLLPPMSAVYRSAKLSLQREREALHDGLTGLANRNLFRERVRRAVSGAPSSTSAAVMLIDLDRFKDVNDTLGHHTGDQLLRQVGRRLREAAGRDATVARLGGDEFGVLLCGDAPPAPSVEVADRLLHSLEEPFNVQGFSLDVGASIGIALFPEHGVDVDTLIQRADVAMYVAKDRQGGRQLYTSASDQHSRRRLALIGQLRDAVDRGQLLLHYQPKLDMRRGTVSAVEALVRWQHPEHGLLPPGEFVPLAERANLVGLLTRHVLGLALGQARAWRDQGLDLAVAVNLSARSLYDASLPDMVAGRLSALRLPARALELEITESTVMADPGRARRVFGQLHAMGLRMAIDDFGTGYSSLAHLKQLPVGELKIDRSFVGRMAHDEDDAVIVRSTIDLAHNLGMIVTAEGVEDLDIWALLDELGCDLAQGYYVSRPLSAEQLCAWLRRGDGPPRLGSGPWRLQAARKAG